MALELSELVGTPTIAIRSQWQTPVTNRENILLRRCQVQLHNRWPPTGSSPSTALVWIPGSGPDSHMVQEVQKSRRVTQRLAFRAACIHRSNLYAFAVASCLLRNGSKSYSLLAAVIGCCR